MAHNIEIVRVFHKDVLGQGDVNEHFAEMRCICPFMENAYTKVGMVKSAGGRMFTVQEGELGMVLRNFAG